MKDAETPTPGYFLTLTPQQKAINFVYGWAKTNARNTDFTVENVKIVWFCKTLQNWKALVAIIGTSDNLFFEVTYNGDKQETYLDAYSKIENVVFKDSDL